ncbi:hypothetical protein [Streptomyces purpurogeneiscleroticus]|uniref:hypothetical protein n=1 Tax=Streptomyces purpurogeneiscleroticus TaxID=68259 RepID=UPI001CBCA38C|nr:hypothetical protein [Streptomyces purpurogeneiscleroticus]MBZ4016297.1 hypothetical protein [Streptomyces purpurogeneiscleroticus]
MGIESDQLVFDYLSRVGDLAQGRGLTAKQRMQLVARLRTEIDARRARGGGDVKRILARLGTPEAVVTAAVNGGEPVPEEPPGGAAERKSGALPSLLKRPGRSVALPSPRSGAQPMVPQQGAAPPHLAGLDELGDRDATDEEEPDWWRVSAEPYAAGETVPGFIGGIEIAEIRRPPETDEEDEAEAAVEDAGPRGLPGVLKKATGKVLPWRRDAAAVPAAEPAEKAEEAGEAVAAPRPKPSPVLLLAVVLLVAGAVIGSWLALAAGWLVAYSSRKLSRAEAKFAALGVPGLVCGSVLVWLWGRFAGKWGDPLAQGQLGAELTDALPVVVRVAAVASAVFLVWRMRRRPR